MMCEGLREVKERVGEEVLVEESEDVTENNHEAKGRAAKIF